MFTARVMNQVIVGVQYTSSGKPYYNGSTMYATGTDNAMTGLATVAEYGPELIVSRSGIATLATSRQLVNMEGGETVYNARQTQEILKGMQSKQLSNESSSDLLRTMIVKLDEVKKAIDSKELNNVINNNYGGVEVNGVTDVREIIEEISEYTEVRRI